MKKAIIIHCWEGSPNYCWYPWLKKELQAKGFEAQVPAMPETKSPKQKLWIPAMHKLIGEPNEDLILVGHSIGCMSILRYLESLEAGQKIGGAILVASFIVNDLGLEALNNYFETPLDFEKIRSHSSKFVAIHSDDDPYVPLKQADTLKEKLKAEVIIKNNMRHFSGKIESKKSCTELPEALEAILRITI